MRLTLRTLLAYLDDILPAAEAKEIGEKIAASPVALQLVQRIQEVPRRRRLTAAAPDGSGGGIDPNLTAEYLDNCLPPNLVADVERVCLESDINLAEVAASHQILTLVLGEPVSISSLLRERMYALGPQGPALLLPDGPPPSKLVRETNAREQMTAIQNANQAPRPAAAPPSLESRLPDYLKRPPLWKRLLPWAALALVAAVWLGLIYGDPTLFGVRSTATNEDASDEQPAADTAPADQDATQPRIAAAPTDEPATPTTSENPEEANAMASSESTDTVPPIDPPPPSEDAPLMEGTPEGTEAPANGTEIAARPEEMKPAETPAAETPETTSTPAMENAPATPPTEGMPAEGMPAEGMPTDTDVPVGDEAPIVIAERHGVVLYKQADSDVWYPTPDDKNPPLGGSLAIPMPFESKLTLPDSPLEVTALGGTRLTPLPTAAETSFGVDLGQGRIRVTNNDPAANGRALRFGLRLGQSDWRLELASPDTAFGIVAQPLQPSGLNEDISAHSPQGIIFVSHGKLKLTSSSGREQTIDAGGRAVLSPAQAVATIGTAEQAPDADATPAAPADSAPAEETDENDTPQPVEAPANSPETPAEQPAEDTESPAPPAATQVPTNLPLGFPTWLAAEEPTPAARRASEAFQEEFLPGVPVSESILPSIKSRFFYIAEPAAQTLGLIENVEGLCKALQEAEVHETRMAAFNGLRNWLGAAPDRSEELRTNLMLVFGSADLVDTLMRLLWGFDMEDARQLEPSQKLIEWMNHDELVVRELAFHYVRQATGITLDYRPTLDEQRRRPSLARWRNVVTRYGGLIRGN